MIHRVLASVVLLAAAGVASAQLAPKDFYAEAGLLELQLEGATTTRKPLLGRFIVGKDIDKNLSIEGLVALNLRKDADTSATTYGVFLKPKMEVAKDVDVFARLGVAHTESKVNAGTYSSTKAAYGLGIQTLLTKTIYTQIDFMHYGKDDQGNNASGFAFSAGYRF